MARKIQALTPSTGKGSPSGAPGASLSVEIEARAKRFEDGSLAFPNGHGLTDAECEAMRRAKAELASALAHRVPFDGGTAVWTILRQVKASFALKLSESEAADAYDGFLIALEGRSAPACFEAVRRIVRFEAPPEYSLTYAPKPGELARLAISIEREWQLEIDRLGWLATLAEDGPDAPEAQPTAEEMAAVRERAARLIAGASRAMPTAHAASRDDDYVSPAARVAAETAARKAKREKGHE